MKELIQGEIAIRHSPSEAIFRQDMTDDAGDACPVRSKIYPLCIDPLPRVESCGRFAGTVGGDHHVKFRLFRSATWSVYN